MQPPLPHIHTEGEQRKQQQGAEQCIGQGVPVRRAAQSAQYIISRAQRKARQHGGRKLRELERYLKPHLSEQLLPDTARGRFILIA